MEQTHNTPIATPAQRQAFKRNQQQRLRDQAEALLRAFEALEPPQSYAEVERAAKALLAVDKVLNTVNENQPEDERIPPACARPPEPEAERTALNTWKAITDGTLAALAEARALKKQMASLAAGAG